MQDKLWNYSLGLLRKYVTDDMARAAKIDWQAVEQEQQETTRSSVSEGAAGDVRVKESVPSAGEASADGGVQGETTAPGDGFRSEENGCASEGETTENAAGDAKESTAGDDQQETAKTQSSAEDPRSNEEETYLRGEGRGIRRRQNRPGKRSC